jgi:hypothetical protein
MMKTRIVSVFLFFSRDVGWFSNLIAKFCGGWSHMGIGFKSIDEFGIIRSFYYESLFAKGPTGPRPLQHLLAWVSKKTGRKLAIVQLGLPENICERKYGAALTWVGLAGYAEWQLLAMLAFERFGRRWGWHVPRSIKRVVCSEYDTRILLPDLDLGGGDRRPDEVTPGSAWDVITAVEITHYP